MRTGQDVTIASIEQPPAINEHDWLIVGGPIYAGNMPDELIQWVRRSIPTVHSGQKAIVFSTSAGLANANGVKSIGKKLIEKGYTLVDTQAFEMPRNFYLDKYEPTPPDVQRRQFEKAGHQIMTSVQKMNGAHDLTIQDSVVMLDFLADVFRIMAKYMGKSFHIGATCIGCGRCEENCPKKNIDHKEKKYANKCILCTRCIHNCPVNAIDYKGKRIEQYRVREEIMTDVS